jgi:hypothetical protein
MNCSYGGSLEWEEKSEMSQVNWERKDGPGHLQSFIDRDNSSLNVRFLWYEEMSHFCKEEKT